MYFNKTFTDELSSIKSAFQSTNDKIASLIERMNTEITSKEILLKSYSMKLKKLRISKLRQIVL